jgi:peptidoglycan hydrolase-like protein with peptidoglycan-binding domain
MRTEIQKLLDELGYPIGAVDGFVGPRTMQSLDALQHKTGRRIDLAEPTVAVEVLRSLRKSK